MGMARHPLPRSVARRSVGTTRRLTLGPVGSIDTCGRALRFGTCSDKSIKSILESGLDRQADELELQFPTIEQENVRGHNYYS